MERSARSRRMRRVGWILTALVLCLIVGCWIYLATYYRALPEALETIREPAQSVTVTRLDGDRLVFAPEDPVAGLIFYPGGKVQYEAYAPLMEACAERGVLCILVRMPGNLAVLAPNAADGLQERYPAVPDWYLAGHSLGGVMAASYASKHLGAYRGLVLLAAYSTADLSESGLHVLSLVGTEDGVLDREKAEAAAENLPPDAALLELEGGCHAYFGCYGPQRGDGTPTISNQAQIRQTADAIAELVAAAAAKPSAA